MIKYFKRAFKITNDNIILTTPLVLFLFLLSIYIGIAQSAPVNIVSFVLLFVTVLFMISAFFAGWFYMVKRAVDLDSMEFLVEEDRAKASFDLIKEIPFGIGDYFLSFVGAAILYTALIVLLVFSGFKVGMHYIGDIGVNVEQLKIAFGSSAAMKTLVSSLTGEQLIKLNAWNILFLVVTSIFSFLTMFWPVEIVVKTKNPLVALFKSITAILKKPLSAIILFLYISFVNFVISFLNAFSSINPILYFISMLLYFYFIVYVVVLIFLYYDREILLKEENKDQGDSRSGADSIGQDGDGDKPGEDD